MIQQPMLTSLRAYSSGFCTEMKQGHLGEVATCWEQVLTCCSPVPFVPTLTRASYWSLFWQNQTRRSASSAGQRRMAAEHSNRRTANAHISPWPVSVAALSCISLATSARCGLVLMVIHHHTVCPWCIPGADNGAHDGCCGEVGCDLWDGPLFGG